MIHIDLTEWEMLVLRAALEKHIKTAGAKHAETAKVVLAKSRAHDRPLVALSKIVSVA